MCPVEKRLWRGWGGLRAGRFGEGKRGLTLFRTFPFPKVVAFGLRFQNGLIRELGRVEVGLGKQLEGAVHGEDGGAEILARVYAR